METSLMVDDYPTQNETKEKCYKFEFNASISGLGYVYAENEEQAKAFIHNKNYEEIAETWGLNIEEITSIKED